MSATCSSCGRPKVPPLGPSPQNACYVGAASVTTSEDRWAANYGCLTARYQREMARANAAERHLANISGALVDAETVVCGVPEEYADAIRELTLERDAWHTAFAAREDEDRAGMGDRLALIERSLRLERAVDAVRPLVANRASQASWLALLDALADLDEEVRDA